MSHPESSRKPKLFKFTTKEWKRMRNVGRLDKSLDKIFHTKTSKTPFNRQLIYKKK